MAFFKLNQRSCFSFSRFSLSGKLSSKILLPIVPDRTFLAISKYLKYSSSSKFKKDSLKFKIIFFSPLT
ncbi:hypothetical protein CFSAN001628_003357 [Clostridium botulinum CFSAN001628]|nr:hypothetical protein CFSAN001628_003357 [Clostridium botulinum CFSAN001628]